MFAAKLFSMAIAAGVLSMTAGVTGYPQAQSFSPCASQEPIEGMTCQDFYSERHGRSVPVWVNSKMIQITDESHASSDINTSGTIDLKPVIGQVPVTDMNTGNLVHRDTSDAIQPESPSLGPSERFDVTTSDEEASSAKSISTIPYTESPGKPKKHCSNTQSALQSASHPPKWTPYCQDLVDYFTQHPGQYEISPGATFTGTRTTIAHYSGANNDSCAVMVGRDPTPSVTPTPEGAGLYFGDQDILAWLSSAARFLNKTIDGSGHVKGTADCDHVSGSGTSSMQWAVTQTDDWGYIPTKRDTVSTNMTDVTLGGDGNFTFVAGDNSRYCLSDFDFIAFPGQGPDVEDCKTMRARLDSMEGFLAVPLNLIIGRGAEIAGENSCGLRVGRITPRFALDGPIEGRFWVGADDMRRWMDQGIKTLAQKSPTLKNYHMASLCQHGPGDAPDTTLPLWELDLSMGIRGAW
jgi:hypothetical protein